jgi:hypothetical protein
VLRAVRALTSGVVFSIEVRADPGLLEQRGRSAVKAPTLCGDIQLLGALGMVSADGRFSPRALRKLRQVEGILPWLLQTLPSSSATPPTIIEFGCGKGYLSFFLAAAVRHLCLPPATILGVDHDPALVQRCQRIRDHLAWDELRFLISTCEQFTTSCAPVLVTSLHACDIATDHVLAAGLDLRAQHIIAAPCCHSTVQRKLRQASHRHHLGYASRSFPLLGSRLSEFVTDALRCLALRAHGYQVLVREFVSGTATPKNALLIAHFAGLHGARPLAELRRLEDTFGITCEVLLSLHRRRLRKEQ